MSSLGYTDQNGEVSDVDQANKQVKDRIRQAREHRKQFEPNWALNLAYAAGDIWTQWDPKARTLRRVQDVDARYRNRELYTADVITEYRTTALGELGGQNDRPNILLARDGEDAEAFEKQLNVGLQFGWDHEFGADSVLAEVDRYLIDLGTAAVRCRWDQTQGQVAAANVPHINGKPILDINEAVQHVAAMAEQGQTADMQDMMAGKIVWEPLSALALLVPPGVTHETRFPWEAVVKPVWLQDVLDEYGDQAVNLKADGDIRTDLGITTNSSLAEASPAGLGAGKQARLKDHVWVFTYFERSSKRFPKGRRIVLASNSMKILDYEEQLPYQGPDGCWRSGLAYFHWWRMTGRFWSRALMDAMRDPARVISKRRVQLNEIIDRSMPFVFVQDGSKASQRKGYPMEMIPLRADERAPVVVSGVQPGTWMQGDVEATREDLEHASGLRGPRLGENPTGVSTYSQLALISENEQTKRNTIRDDRQAAIRQLVEDSVHDMRSYWGPQKQMMIAGSEGTVEATIFNATQIPTWFLVQQAKGTPAPRNQAAKLQLITDIWNASVTAAQPLPVSWYKASLESGEPLELPQEDMEQPADKAELENYMMTARQVDMPIAYYDQHAVHLPIHRRAQDDALFSGNMQLWQLVEQHCQRHIQAAAAQQAAVQQQAAVSGAQQAIAEKPPALQPQQQNGQNPGPSGPPVPNQGAK